VNSVRRTVLCLVNRTRRARGLHELTIQHHLQRAAASYSDRMVATHFFSNTTPAGLTADQRVRRSGYTADADRWAWCARDTELDTHAESVADLACATAMQLGMADEDEIPLIARVVAVCDAYDAIVTERVYRHARAPATAIAELERCSGKQFDPEVVGAFVSATEGMHG
jgi:hypothetical protein